MILDRTAIFFKQTLAPIVNYYKCSSYGSGENYPNDVQRFRTDSFEDNLKEAQRIWSGQGSCKPNNCTMRRRPTSFINNAFMPVRFHPEPSMHRPACPDFSKTRLHSLPITKSLENPVTYESPWSPFLGGCRWYSTDSEYSSFEKKTERLRTKDDFDVSWGFRDRRRL